MNKNLIIILLLVIYFSSCRKRNSIDNKPITNNDIDKICNNIEFKKRVFYRIISNKDVCKYLHLDDYNKSDISIYKYPFFRNMVLFVDNNKVNITLDKESEHLIDLNIKSCSNERITFNIFFSAENASIIGYIENDNDFEVVIESEVEF